MTSYVWQRRTFEIKSIDPVKLVHGQWSVEKTGDFWTATWTYHATVLLDVGETWTLALNGVLFKLRDRRDEIKVIVKGKKSEIFHLEHELRSVESDLSGIRVDLVVPADELKSLGREMHAEYEASVAEAKEVGRRLDQASARRSRKPC